MTSERHTDEQRAGSADVPRCLVVTDDLYLARLIRLLLDHGAYEGMVVTDQKQAEAAIEHWQPHLAVVDIDIDQGTGIELVGRWKSRG